MQNVLNVIIIGGGPAGLTAGIYTGRALLKPLLFEGVATLNRYPGGQLVTTTDVENYPGFLKIEGPTLVDNMRIQAMENGCEIEREDIIHIDFSQYPYIVTASNNKKYQTKSIIIATGASAKRLGVKGEDTLWNNGISACAVCDGALPIFKKKRLVVVGGGDTACEEALYLSKYASEVLLIHRRDELRASKVMQQKVLNNTKIKIIYNTQVVEAHGISKLVAISVITMEDGKKKSALLEVSGLFYAIGHQVNTDLIKDVIELDEDGYVKNSITKMKGVFACGDVTDKIFRQAITAAGSGCQAGLNAIKYLEE